MKSFFKNESQQSLLKDSSDEHKEEFIPSNEVQEGIPPLSSPSATVMEVLEIKEKTEEETLSDSKSFFKYRWFLFFFLFFSPFFAYTLRITLSISIIPMSNEFDVL